MADRKTPSTESPARANNASAVGEVVDRAKEIAQDPQKVSLLWKFFGAMILERKEGERALSLTRVLTLICFLCIVSIWMGVPFLPTEVPEPMMEIFYVLLGGKTVESVAAIIKNKKGS